MKASPLSLKAEEVRAVLSGEKTDILVNYVKSPLSSIEPLCPLGDRGDYIWVTEDVFVAPPGFVEDSSDLNNTKDPQGRPRMVGYAASMNGDEVAAAKRYNVPRIPASKAPRWTSRIYLEISGVELVDVRTNEDDPPRHVKKWRVSFKAHHTI